MLLPGSEGLSLERKLAAVIAADVVGYSRLVGEDELGTVSSLSALIEDQISPLIKRYNGRVVKLTGDGILAEFSSAVDAVLCAIVWQRDIATPASSFQFRIGINLGDIIFKDGDIYGDDVNIAARLEALAEPGTIYISSSVHQNLGN